MSIRTIPLVVSLLLGVAGVEAAPVSVRLPEGNTRGFLVLRSGVVPIAQLLRAKLPAPASHGSGRE